MNVWVRVVSVLDVDENASRGSATTATIQSELEITVYRTKERAKKAQAKAGGIILEVNAIGLSEVHNEFGKEVLVSQDDESEVEGSTKASICVASVGQPVPNYGGYEPGTVEPQGDILKFSADEEAWLNDFANLTGFDLHQ